MRHDGHRMPKVRRQDAALILLNLIAVGMACGLVLDALSSETTVAFEACRSLFPATACSMVSNDNVISFGVATLGLLPLALLLERLIPANPQQPLLSVGLAHDAVWYVLYPVLKIVLYAGVGTFLAAFHAKYLGFLKLGSPGLLPRPVQIVLVVAATDFLAWLHHLVRHKVPLLWEFHAVHHSQTQLNVLSDLRVHPIDYLAARVIQFIPFYSLSLDVALPTFVLWEIFKIFYTKFCHANMRTNLGPLRHVLVTPQSHRIHHSREPVHADRNFGVIFSIWDTVFRTRYAGADEYPAVGIRDERFPLEKELTFSSLLLMPLRQLCYPVRAALLTVRVRPDR